MKKFTAEDFRSLSALERIKLAQDILETIVEDDSSELSLEEMQLVKERYADYEKNPGVGVSFDEAKAMILSGKRP
ncbi:MAG: addiction module protein [Planctomycetes bacterium]|nr:addiction module protein [Planctomycetota bacterium]